MDGWRRNRKVQLMTHLSFCLGMLLAAPHTDGSGQEKNLRADLADARRKWEERRPSSYEFTVEVRCFCYGPPHVRTD